MALISTLGEERRKEIATMSSGATSVSISSGRAPSAGPVGPGVVGLVTALGAAVESPAGAGELPRPERS